MPSFDVCVLGSLNMDLVVRATRLPQPGETLLGGPFERHPGGKGANQAVAAARAGAKVAMIGAVGGDEHGARLLDVLAAEGVDVSHVARHACASGVALITVAEDGENSIVVAPGANAELSATDVEHAAELVASSRILLAQLETPLEAVARAFALAKEHGKSALLNAAPARRLSREVLAATDALIVNESEARSLCGADAPRMGGDRAGTARALAGTLRELGAPKVVLTLGRSGALLAHEGGVLAQRAFEVECVDSTGAGDAFAGAFAAALAQGADDGTALARACAAGALATTRRGAIPSMPARAEIERLLSTAARA